METIIASIAGIGAFALTLVVAVIDQQLPAGQRYHSQDQCHRDKPCQQTVAAFMEGVPLHKSLNQTVSH
ncbi:hypothetical protein GF356_04570 [candidate division GN15 bacterium]|nr:hypothetical protein [candidate division GN15 bacterium]